MITLCRLFGTLGAAMLMTLAATAPAYAAPAGCRADHLCVWKDYPSTGNTLNYATYSGAVRPGTGSVYRMQYHQSFSQSSAGGRPGGKGIGRYCAASAPARRSNSSF